MRAAMAVILVFMVLYGLEIEAEELDEATGSLVRGGGFPLDGVRRGFAAEGEEDGGGDAEA